MITIEEWKNYIKEKNYKKILEENFRNAPLHNRTLEQCIERANDVEETPLTYMFYWGASPQGHSYWEEIANKQTSDLF